LKKRRVTDKHLAYLFNALVLSKIEYRAQAVVFSKKEIEKIMSPFRKLFKNKMAFASSAPNSIVKNSLIYKVRTFKDNQAQAKIANFLVQINDDKLLGKIMDIRLLQVQAKLLLEKSILLENPYNLLEIQKIAPKLKDNFIIRNLGLMKSLDFGFKMDSDNRKEKNNYVTGDKILLREILDKKFFIKNFRFFRKYNLLFLNQITTLDVSQLLGEGFLFKRKYINDSCLNSFMDFKVYQEIKEKLCVVDSFKLTA
jgi:hypothetical protein